MKKLIVILLLSLTILFAGCTVIKDFDKESAVKITDPIMDKTMEGLNENNYEKFTEYFGKLKGLGYKAYEWNTKSPILICGYCHTIKRRVYYQSFTTNSNKIKIKELLDETFGKVKLKISKIPNIGEKIL